MSARTRVRTTQQNKPKPKPAVAVPGQKSKPTTNTQPLRDLLEPPNELCTKRTLEFPGSCTYTCGWAEALQASWMFPRTPAFSGQGCSWDEAPEAPRGTFPGTPGGGGSTFCALPTWQLFPLPGHVIITCVCFPIAGKSYVEGCKTLGS